MKLDLTGKTAVVCGSTQGIGKAAAIELAQMGARIFLVARNEEKLAQTTRKLPTPNQQEHGYLVADFAHPDEVKKTIAGFSQENTAHILVNNTGGPPGGAAIDADEEAYTQAFKLHVLCNQILAQALVPGMKAAEYGRIVNIISTSVKIPISGLGVSNTIRGAVASWAKTLAYELASFGITVNNVLPGATTTSRLFSLLEARAERAGHSYDVEEKQWLEGIPADRFAEPQEVAAAVAFLATPHAAYINGINLPVDGGRTGCL